MTEELPFSVPERHEAAVKTLLLGKEIFDKLNIHFWLVCGTLLGVMREHDFIAHDSDIDLGVWDDDSVDHVAIIDAFIQAGFSLAHEYGGRGNGRQYSFWSPWGVYFDIYFVAKEQDFCWLSVWVNGTLRKLIYKPIENFIEVEFCGTAFSIPENYEQQFLDQYGPDWRTPIPPVERGGTWSWSDSPRNYR